ncbi:sensor histidine kinase [Sphingorhabdus contaminans]|uniref:sensor histidine kinase n=1 Tax=Sphingorhabdus contaminans TaxID=1343899 RepID=UPI003D26FA52
MRIWRDSTTAALVVILVLLSFWGAVLLGENAVRPDGMTSRPSVQFQPIDDDGNVIDPRKILTAPYFKDPIYRSTVEEGGRRVAFLIPFKADKLDDDLVFFIGPTPGLQEIQLNGQVIQPNIPLDTLRGAADGKALYYMLPPSAVRGGDNEIKVLVETQSPILALAPFHIGPAVEAARATSRIDLITNFIPTIAVSFLIFAFLLCAVVNWPSVDRPRVRTLMVLMVAWAARTYFITFQTPIELPFLITSFIYYLLEGSVVVAFARHLLAGEPLSQKWSRWFFWLWIALIVYLAGITIAGFVVGPAIREWFKNLALLISVALLILALIGLPLLAWGIATRSDGRRLERFALMFCLLALVVDAGDSAFDWTVPFFPELPLTFYAAASAGLLLGLGVVASIAREASEARRTVVQSNEILAAKLDEQNAELARSYDAQKQMLQRQVMLEERQRIVRDMHDGIGGQLLGLMMQVRQGGADKIQVEQGLQSSIADLRLIVDSMDSADDGLAETLRSFEHRVRAQVEAAGLAFTVEHGLKDGEPGPGPRPTLQILRILQEAVTNAMRHSGGTEISLISRIDENCMIHISIRDDGRGLPAEIKGGRGLTSMRSRAEAVGGNLKIDGNGGGTTLSLIIPGPA